MYMSSLTKPSYRDFYLLTSKEQKKIELYSHYLEPGSTFKLLRPTDPITYAEAVVIVSRFLRWRQGSVSSVIR